MDRTRKNSQYRKRAEDFTEEKHDEWEDLVKGGSSDDSDVSFESGELYSEKSETSDEDHNKKDQKDKRRRRHRNVGEIDRKILRDLGLRGSMKAYRNATTLEARELVLKQALVDKLHL